MYQMTHIGLSDKLRNSSFANMYKKKSEPNKINQTNVWHSRECRK